MAVAAVSTIGIEQELDFRWLAEVPIVPGALADGSTVAEAAGRAEALALRALAERIEHGEPMPEISGLFVDGLPDTETLAAVNGSRYLARRYATRSTVPAGSHTLALLTLGSPQQPPRQCSSQLTRAQAPVVWFQRRATSLRSAAVAPGAWIEHGDGTSHHQPRGRAPACESALRPPARLVAWH